MGKTKLQNQTVTIKTNEENPEPIELIADSIIKIADAMQVINNSRLSQRAVILLIKDAVPGNIPMGDIRLVLEYAAKLKDIYIKKSAAVK